MSSSVASRARLVPDTEWEELKRIAPLLVLLVDGVEVEELERRGYSREDIEKARTLIGRLVHMGVLRLVDRDLEDILRALGIKKRVLRHTAAQRTRLSLSEAREIGRAVAEAISRLARPAPSVADAVVVGLAVAGVKSNDPLYAYSMICRSYRLASKSYTYRRMFPEKMVVEMDDACVLVEALASARRSSGEYSVAIPLPREAVEKLVEDVMEEDIEYISPGRPSRELEGVESIKDILLTSISEKTYNLMVQRLISRYRDLFFHYAHQVMVVAHPDILAVVIEVAEKWARREGAYTGAES